VADRWILTRLHDTAQAVASAFDAYNFSAAAETLWNFIWYELCDWYVEATKNPQLQRSRAPVLSFVLNHAMRLLHPIEPFISEEVWLALPHDGETIVTAAWPDLAEIPVDRAAAGQFESLRMAVERLRNLRAEIGLQPRDVLDLEVPAAVPETLASLAATFTAGRVLRVDGVQQSLEEAMAAIAGVAPKGVLAERYKKEAVRLLAEVERSEAKLANERFVANAKPDVVAKEREKLEQYRSELARVRAALDGIGGAT